MSMKNTSLLMLSSPEGDSNYYSTLMNLMDEDHNPPQPFFNVINCFQICKKCLKLERVKQINCTHVKSTAHWLSSRKIKKLKQLYKASPEDAIREFGGVVVSDYLPALPKVRRIFFFYTYGVLILIHSGRNQCVFQGPKGRHLVATQVHFYLLRSHRWWTQSVVYCIRVL